MSESAAYPRRIVEGGAQMQGDLADPCSQSSGGVVEPSDDDRRITEEIRQALALVEIGLQEHVILAGNDYYSFRRNGIIPVKYGEDKMEILVQKEVIEGKIYILRGHKVMLSTDLAELYEVEPKVLMQAVKRNIERFPADFMFMLTNQAVMDLKSQIVTSSWGDRRRANPKRWPC